MADSNPKVKICGLMHPGDAEFAAKAGADLLGVVLAPSKRRVSVSQAQEIFSQVEAEVLRVGVFVDPSLKDLEKAAKGANLDLLQLHGRESPDFCRQASAIRPIIKVVTEEFGVWSPEPGSYHGLELEFLLVDSRSGKTRGGTGRRLSREALQQAESFGIAPLAIAGGLNPENVGPLLGQVRPALVDVSSGVEAALGKKDPGAVKAFIQVVKSAANDLSMS